MNGPRTDQGGADLPCFLIWANGAERYAERIASSPWAGRVDIVTAAEGVWPGQDVLDRIDAVYAKVLPEGALARMPRLKWVQAEAAGVDRFLERADMDDRFVLTAGRGIHRLQMPDTIIGSIFNVTKPFARLREQQERKVWNRIVPESVGGKTLAIFGLGAIGKVLARKASALEMRVIGVNRSGAEVDHVDAVHALAERDVVLGMADHVVLLLPLTPETADIVDARWLAAMKSDAWLHNFSRGAMVDDDALIAAAASGGIAGAVLDAYRQEPLPPDHPFWVSENVHVLPHIGGLHPDRDRFIEDLIVENLGRFLNGQELLSVVDPNQGY